MDTTRDAAAALAEVARHQEGVIARVNVPGWYWWLVALGIVPVGVAADTRSAAVVAPVAVGYGLVIALVTIWLIAGGRPGARVSHQLLGPAAAVGIVLFVWIVVGASLGVAFALQAAGFGHPGAAGTLLGAVIVLAGGPLLRRWLRAVMLRNRA